MFSHKMDPLVKSEIARLQGLIDSQASEIVRLKADFGHMETKLDQILAALDNPESRSIPADKKPETIEVGPGYTPWSRRKQERVRKSASPNFIEKVKKSTALKEPEGEVNGDEAGTT